MTPPCGVPVARGSETPILELHGRLEPALDVEQHPAARRVMTYGFEYELVVDAVKEPLNIEIEDPIRPPAPLASRTDRIDGRAPGTVSIRVLMKPGLQQVRQPLRGWSSLS